MANKTIYFTTPVFYPSANPHLGHAFSVILADALKRYHATLGYRCMLIVGTDEHGEKLFRIAELQNIPVEEFIEGYVVKFKNLWQDLGINYDKFVRTSDYQHKAHVRQIFEEYDINNQIYFDNWQGWYCASCEEGYSFRSIEKTAVCRLGHPLILKNEETYFLKCRSFKHWLLKEYQDKPDLIYPAHYKKEMINNFINDLDDLSISRSSVTWGVKVPGREEHTVYVWFDGLISYISALNYGNYGKTSTLSFKNFWENPNGKIVHIIGKEICRFHSIYWPIMLQNLGLKLFDTLLVHGWLLMNDEKMSKSKQNVIDPAEVIKSLPREALRFYLMKFNCFIDNQTCTADIYNTYNSFLANTYGNLISRFYGIMKKFDLQLPSKIDLDACIEADQLDIQITNFLETNYETYITKYSVHSLVDDVFNLFRTAGKLIEKNKAWELQPEDPLLQTLVCTIYRLLCIGTWALSPILIDTAPEILEALGVSTKRPSLSFFKNKKNYIKKVLNPLPRVFYPRITDVPNS